MFCSGVEGGPALPCRRALFNGSLNVIPGTDPGSPLTEPLTAEQWKAIFSLSKKQSLLGVIYGGIKRLPAELQPPADLMQQWMQLASRYLDRITFDIGESLWRQLV